MYIGALICKPWALRGAGTKNLHKEHWLNALVAQFLACNCNISSTNSVSDICCPISHFPLCAVNCLIKHKCHENDLWKGSAPEVMEIWFLPQILRWNKDDGCAVGLSIQDFVHEQKSQQLRDRLLKYDMGFNGPQRTLMEDVYDPPSDLFRASLSG